MKGTSKVISLWQNWAYGSNTTLKVGTHSIVFRQNVVCGIFLADHTILVVKGWNVLIAFTFRSAKNTYRTRCITAHVRSGIKLND